MLLRITKLSSNVGFTQGWTWSPRMAGLCTIGVGRGSHACGHQVTQPNTLASLRWFLKEQGQSAAGGSPSFLPGSLLPCPSSDPVAPTATRLDGPSSLGFGDLGFLHCTELGSDDLLQELAENWELWAKGKLSSHPVELNRSICQVSYSQRPNIHTWKIEIIATSWSHGKDEHSAWLIVGPQKW